MDALTISGLVGIVTLIIALCVYLFKVFTRETTFEEAYGKNALKLLTEEKLQKAKAKAVKGKKTVVKAISVKDKPNAQEKQETEPISAEAPEKEVELPVSKSSSTASSSRFPVQSTSDVSPPDSLGHAEPLKEAIEDVSTKKLKKKNRSKKADVPFSAEGYLAGVQQTEEKIIALSKVEKEIEKDIAQPEKVMHVTKLATENNNATNSFPKHSTKQEVADNISMSDVIERMKSMKSLEPEYAAFLSHYADLSNFRELKLQDDIDFLKKQNVEKEKSLKQLNVELNNSRNENSKLKSGLKEQYDKYETFEQTVRSKLTEILQLKEENKRLNAAISENQQKSSQHQQLIREVEVMKTELAKKSNLANDELIAKKKQIEKLQADNAEISKICRENMATKSSYENELNKVQAELQRVKDQHAKEYQTAQQQIVELTGEVERAFAIYADANKAQSFQFEQAQNMKSENEKLNSELSNLKAKCQLSEQEIEQSNSNMSQYKNHINQLALELHEARSSLTMSKENEKAMVELEEKNAKLTTQLKITQEKLQDYEEWQRKASAEKFQTTELVKKNLELEAEIQNLTNQIHYLSSQQNDKTNDFVLSEVQEQLEQQKKKNQELRDSNYKLLETVQSQELTTKKLLTGLESKYEAGLKEMVTAATKNLKQALPSHEQLPTLDGSYTIENLGTWLQKLAEVLQENVPPAAAAVPFFKEKSQKSDSKEEIEKLTKSISHYKFSLQQVKNQLKFVERVAEEVDKEQRTKIAQLEKSLETLGVLKASCTTKPDECCPPEISSIHELNNEEVKSSVSEEWEVVGESGH